MAVRIKYDDDRHRYWVNGLDVPSVTEVIDATTAKDALAWWGMRVGAAGVVAMMADVAWAKIANANTPEEIIRPKILTPERGFIPKNGRKGKYVSLVEAWIRDAQRTTNDELEKAGLRGDETHYVAECLAEGKLPDVGDIQPDHRGYVAGLVQWWLDQEPEFEESEVIVGSDVHRFAGRMDAVGRDRQERRGLTDFKSSSNIYLSYAEQLSAYRIGYEETYEHADPIDFHQVVWVGYDGSYLVIEMEHVPKAFLAALNLWHERAESARLHRNRTGIYEIDNKKRW